MVIVSYKLNLGVINYQTAILRGNIEAAQTILPKIPQYVLFLYTFNNKRDQYERVAQFLESLGYLPQALEVTVDPEHKFDLAVQLGELAVAHEMAKKLNQDHKWKQLGDLALSKCNVCKILKRLTKYTLSLNLLNLVCGALLMLLDCCYCILRLETSKGLQSWPTLPKKKVFRF